MPTGSVTPAGGAAFNGGTITGTLEIDTPAATDGLIVKVNNRTMLSIAGDGSIRIQAEPGHNSGGLTVDASGRVFLFGDGNAQLEIDTDDSMILGAGATIVVTPQGALAIETLQEEPPTADIPTASMEPWYESTFGVDPAIKVIAKQQGSGTIVRGAGLRLLAAAGYHLAINDHAAPADGELEAGDMCIWFDQTNGAAALNVKAKQANGTVKTATIPVVT